MRVGDASAVAERLYSDAGIAVYSLESSDAPDLLRVSVGADEEIDRFLAALRDAM